MKNLVSCPICNREFKSLMSHLLRIHRSTPSSVLLKYPNTKMVSESVKNKASRSCKMVGCGKWMREYKWPDWRKKEYSSRFSGKNNTFYGKTHTKKTRRKMSKNHADFNGDKNPLRIWLKDTGNKEKYCSGVKRWMTEKWENKEYRKIHSERLSKQTSKQHLNGFNPYSNCKHGWFESKKFGLKIYYQSSYEEKFMEYCEHSTKIKALQRVPFMIPYKDDSGICRNYIADFLINKNVVVEIKPKSMLDYNQNRQKIEAARIYCRDHKYKYKLLTEDELKNLDQIL